MLGLTSIMAQTEEEASKGASIYRVTMSWRWTHRLDQERRQVKVGTEEELETMALVALACASDTRLSP